MPNWRHPMAQNPFPSFFIMLLPPLRMDFSAPSAELGERCSRWRVLTLLQCVFLSLVTGSLFKHWTQEARGGLDATLCVTNMGGEAVCQKSATLWRQHGKNHTLAKYTISQCKATVSSLNEGWGKQFSATNCAPGRGRDCWWQQPQ